MYIYSIDYSKGDDSEVTFSFVVLYDTKFGLVYSAVLTFSIQE